MKIIKNESINNIVVGKNAVKSCILSSTIVKHIYLLNYDKEIIALANEHKIDFEIISKENMINILKDASLLKTNNQGILAIIDSYKYYSLDEFLILNKKKARKPILLMLDQITDVHNFGAIIRSSVAFNVDGIIILNHDQAMVNTTVHKTSSGASFFQKIIQVHNLSQTIDKLKKASYWIIATDLNSSISYTDIETDIPLVLIVGNEQKGVSKNLLAKADIKFKIPMNSKMESLNVSVATAIILSNLYQKSVK